MRDRSRSDPRILLTVCLLGAMAMTTEPAGAADRTEIRRLLADAQSAVDRGDSVTAVATLDSVLVLDPTNPDAPYRLGLLRLAGGDTAGAERILADGVAAAPLSRRLKLLLAFVRLDADPRSSKGLVDEVLMLRRHDVDALYLRGRLALAEGDSARALSVWDQLLEREAGGGSP